MKITMKGVIIPAVFVILLYQIQVYAVRTALDDYIEKPDPSYSWSLYQTQPYYGLGGGGPVMGTIYTLRMTSQTWRSATEVNRTQWNHWVQFCVPVTPTPNLCLLIIDGGSISGTWGTPSDVSDYAFAANLLGCCLAYLQYIPNEPLRFS
ncbi:MAG TPA: PhoPQ-activated protein PqaA family protein, partial [Candidatus Hydrogenedentes bacterium]|nr:PhoPQ-activated protein PqaA family protein [Candidatus Hydrogenedentota bacterium]